MYGDYFSPSKITKNNDVPIKRDASNERYKLDSLPMFSIDLH